MPLCFFRVIITVAAASALVVLLLLPLPAACSYSSSSGRRLVSPPPALLLPQQKMNNTNRENGGAFFLCAVATTGAEEICTPAVRSIVTLPGNPMTPPVCLLAHSCWPIPAWMPRFQNFAAHQLSPAGHQPGPPSLLAHSCLGPPGQQQKSAAAASAALLPPPCLCESGFIHSAHERDGVLKQQSSGPRGASARDSRPDQHLRLRNSQLSVPARTTATTGCYLGTPERVHPHVCILCCCCCVWLCGR